jgi:hypothetical protein
VSAVRLLTGDGSLASTCRQGVPGSVAEAAAKEKEAQYASLQGAEFQAIAHEQFGRMNKGGEEFLKQMAGARRDGAQTRPARS